MYANFLHNYPTLTPTLSSIHAFTSKNHFTPNLRTEPLFLHLQPKKSRIIINCAANSDGVKGAVNWAEILEKWSPKNFLGADKLFRAISGATSSPIAQYIPAPFTFVHSVDPRIKLAWLFTLVILPAKSNVVMRLSLVAYLAILSILVQPAQVWKDLLGRVTLLSGILFIMLGLSTDSAPSLISSRAPPPSMMGLPSFPASLEGYKYVVLKLGPLQLTRKGLSTATTSACLTFTVSSDLPFVVELT
ncbi:hypothetical protein AABB24_021687 [Solanum stoloniferum]|uniref:Uncharacterized protein n=1 Tax=Solanum stoloniferum TaxID=62892 RepID=A0ABD2SW83_9SOLN